MANNRDRIEARLRAAALKMTPQRFAVLDYLMRSSTHPTAEQVRADLNRRFPRASRATVYNTLNALRDAGLIHEIYMDDAVARYDANIDPHHHFVCRKCGRLEDVPVSTVDALSIAGLEPGHTVETYQIVMRGICARCNGRPARSPSA
jgi:Fe2+ or Zn2+ uptake regulation protein